MHAEERVAKTLSTKDEVHEMISPRSWEEFRASGLLWWVNRTLHLFGWAIAVELQEDGTVSNCYPARCKFRGFGEKSESDGFEKLTEHMAESIPQLLNDAKS